MENIQLEPTFKTPKVLLNKDTGKLIISGRSLPENAEDFYFNIKQWLIEYFETPALKTDIQFKLNYYNTASSKMILELFKLLKVGFQSGIDITVTWGHDKNDEEVKEDGKDFADIVGIPIIVKPIEN